jgi:leucine-zipper-like transcriptional regulator 1
VRRELEVLTPIPGPDAEFTISDRSASMTGTSLPPGLRFPTGAVLGHHLVLTGTYLAHSFQTYSVWALDLTTNVWHRIEPGTPLTSGSWFRSCLWVAGNRLVVFGDRHGSLVEDYNRRLLCWDYVCTIDLEAFGVYQPPRAVIDTRAQVLGLAALESGILTDFELIAEDGRKVRVSRRILEERWPWFRGQRQKFEQQARQTAASLPATASSVALPVTATPVLEPNPEPANGQIAADTRPDPRLTPRAFYLTEPYPITLALAQYFYTQALITPLQHAPAVLSQLLVLSSLYNLEHLQRLTAHAMHRVLSKSTSVGIYEVATLSSCRSLQIRALKMVMVRLRFAAAVCSCSFILLPGWSGV